jgi:hypothetical protein
LFDTAIVVRAFAAPTTTPRFGATYRVVVEDATPTGRETCPTTLGSVTVRRPAVVAERKYTSPATRPERPEISPERVISKLLASITRETTPTTSAVFAADAMALA